MWCVVLTLQLSITVGDVNDNDPQFDEPIIFETLSENEDTNPVFTFTASDLDDGLNGDILYSLDDGFGELPNCGVCVCTYACACVCCAHVYVCGCVCVSLLLV